MNLIDKIITEWSWRTAKGYPDINSEEDLRIFEEVFGFALNEKVLGWNDLGNESRKYYRFEVIADKIDSGEEFQLASGETARIKFANPSYAELFKAQDADKIKEIGGVRINLFPFFEDESGNKLAFKDLEKTRDLGGTGGSKAETSERQERALIEAINNAVEEKGTITLVGKDGHKIENIVKADKVPDPSIGEAYADIVLDIRGGGKYMLSAKGTQTPSMAGGGLKGITTISPELKDFVVNFYKDAYDYYKKIFDKTTEVDYETNLYKTAYFKDVNREIPQDIVLDMLRGNEAMGGPVDGYYIGPMEVQSELKDNELHVNANLVPIEEFMNKYPKLYAHIKKRSGDYYFTDANQTVKTSGAVLPAIFINKPDGGTAKSRFGVNPKPRGQVII